MPIKKDDFIELEYTGCLPDGTIFDTTLPDIARQHNIYNPHHPCQNAIICVGEHQLLSGLDDDLIGKEAGCTYQITIPAEKAFGKRDIKRLKIVPAQTFKENKMQPHLGQRIDVDGEIGRVTSVSGGRIIVNFNHPLAGKDITYEYKIIRLVDDNIEKIQHYLHRSIHLPLSVINVSLHDNSASVTIPFTLPQPLLDALSEKLKRITGISEISFHTSQSPSPPAISPA